jgi:Cdc6-like AAA superfamily ATPase
MLSRKWSVSCYEIPNVTAPPQALTFHAYKRDDIAEIVEARLAMIDECIFDHKAIQYLSGKASESGDIRKALDMSLAILNEAREAGKVIQIPQVLKVIKKLSSETDPVERIPKISFNMQLLLWCTVKKTQQNTTNTCTVSEVRGLIFENH